jgi:FkbM family methyltransferase
MDVLVNLVGRLPRPWLKAIARLQWRHPLLKLGFEWAANQFRNQDSVIQQGIGKGLRFNVGNSHAGYQLGTTEPAMQAAIKELLQPNMTFYDIGANVGFFSIIAAHLSGGTVVCFEPLAENVHYIKHNAALNHLSNILIRSEALGCEDGDAIFNVSAVSSWGKLATVGEPTQKIRDITVPLRRLDTSIRESNLPQPELIKIDVEGAEVDVLVGARETLLTHRPILLVELHGTNEVVARELAKVGYQCHVLGSTASPTESPWDAQVLAVPNERSDLESVVVKLTHSI